MRFLIDTHALLWLLRDDARLAAPVRQTLGDPNAEGWVSIVSLWEIAIKTRIGKLRIAHEVVVAALPLSGLRLLDVNTRHIATLAQLPRVPRHNDPFDHLLIAQAITEELTFVSDDAYVSSYAVPVLRCS